MQLSNNLERLKEKYYILAQEKKSTCIDEAEGIMGQLEEIVTEMESNLMEMLTKTKSNVKLLFMKKLKVCVYTSTYLPHS